MKVCYAGIDVGSSTTKAVILGPGQNVLGNAIVPTSASAKRAAEEALSLALGEASVATDSLARTVATGYGRDLVSFSEARVTEITCHARGAFQRLGGGCTLIDIGGQDSKAIAVGPSGKVASFLMNDRCAAGTGRFLEVMARALESDIEGLSAMARMAPRRAKINSLCTVFAESEVVGLIASGTPREEIASGLAWSVAERVGSLAKRVGLDGRVWLSGGVAYNAAVVAALSEHLLKEVRVIPEPQLNGAFGAALIAAEGDLRPSPSRA
jgi:predicted CoA-substrate-specific enzyme activase